MSNKSFENKVEEQILTLWQSDGKRYLQYHRVFDDESAKLFAQRVAKIAKFFFEKQPKRIRSFFVSNSSAKYIERKSLFNCHGLLIKRDGSVLRTRVSGNYWTYDIDNILIKKYEPKIDEYLNKDSVQYCELVDKAYDYEKEDSLFDVYDWLSEIVRGLMLNGIWVGTC